MGKLSDASLGGDLFSGSLIRGMHRNPDHKTSIEAAREVNEIRGTLQKRVYQLLLERSMTDGELERLEEFEGYRYSTVRKRRSELFQMGWVIWTGLVRDKQNVWTAVTVPVPRNE